MSLLFWHSHDTHSVLETVSVVCSIQHFLNWILGLNQPPLLRFWLQTAVGEVLFQQLTALSTNPGSESFHEGVEDIAFPGQHQYSYFHMAVPSKLDQIFALLPAERYPSLALDDDLV